MKIRPGNPLNTKYYRKLIQIFLWISTTLNTLYFVWMSYFCLFLMRINECTEERSHIFELELEKSNCLSTNQQSYTIDGSVCSKYRWLQYLNMKMKKPKSIHYLIQKEYTRCFKGNAVVDYASASIFSTFFELGTIRGH